jgi:hypothetical protein
LFLLGLGDARWGQLAQGSWGACGEHSEEWLERTVLGKSRETAKVGAGKDVGADQEGSPGQRDNQSCSRQHPEEPRGPEQRETQCSRQPGAQQSLLRASLAESITELKAKTKMEGKGQDCLDAE